MFFFSSVGFHMEEGGGKEYGVLFYFFIFCLIPDLLLLVFLLFGLFKIAHRFSVMVESGKLGWRASSLLFSSSFSKPASCC